MNLAVPISVSTVVNSFKIEVQALQFNTFPPMDALSDFQDNSSRGTLSEGFNTTINDPTILIDHYQLPDNHCNDLVEGIICGTASIISDGSFDPATPIGPAGSSTVILASSTECNAKFQTRACNCVTGPESSQSTYRSELADVILALTILNILVRRHNNTEGAVTITLDGETAMDESRGDWSLSFDQINDYLQVIRAQIKSSPLTFHLHHVKGHQTKNIPYNQLDWWRQQNEDVDTAAKWYLRECMARSLAKRKSHVQPILQLGKWALARDGTKFTSIYKESLYTNLYGSHTIAYWAKRDNIPKDLKCILWEESLQAMKQILRAQRQLDKKILSNQCGLAKTIFDRKQQNIHTCPVCKAPKEDRNHLFTCQDPAAKKNFEKFLKELEKKWKN